MNRDDGFASAEWLAGIALVVLPAVIVALSVADWAERTLTAHTIADEVARAAVLAPHDAVVEAESARVARLIARNRGFDLAPSCSASGNRCVTVDVRGRLVRGATITVEVVMPIPGVQLPLAGTVGGFHATVTASERVDDHRSIPP